MSATNPNDAERPSASAEPETAHPEQVRYEPVRHADAAEREQHADGVGDGEDGGWLILAPVRVKLRRA